MLPLGLNTKTLAVQTKMLKQHLPVSLLAVTDIAEEVHCLRAILVAEWHLNVNGKHS